MKIIVIGNVNTGKTSLCRRYGDGIFTDDYKPTIGVDFVVRNGHQLWDVAGQERFSSVTMAYYRGAHGALVVLDWTDPNAVEQTEKWIHDLKTKNPVNVPILIVANKCDLPGRITLEDLDALCKSNDRIIGWIETSAKTGQGVEEAIQRITSVERKPREKDRDIIQLDEDVEDEITKTLCCEYLL